MQKRIKIPRLSIVWIRVVIYGQIAHAFGAIGKIDEILLHLYIYTCTLVYPISQCIYLRASAHKFVKIKLFRATFRHIRISVNRVTEILVSTLRSWSLASDNSSPFFPPLTIIIDYLFFPTYTCNSTHSIFFSARFTSLIIPYIKPVDWTARYTLVEKQASRVIFFTFY